MTFLLDVKPVAGSRQSGCALPRMMRPAPDASLSARVSNVDKVSPNAPDRRRGIVAV
ncbi:hypothetical protein AAC691_21640 [Nguyenibacter vanlangensis]|uniref:Uncharacterized protein n=1 Tax=Nguyenibacter vanlangensis TaxID=1216886 RepID=A0ABZ3D4Z7_9PROT